MPLSITEIPNPNESKFKPIPETQDIYVPDITNTNISRRNGMVYCLTGSGGSGKTNLLLNLFKSKTCYRNKFHNIYYFCPAASFNSLKNHPFENHDKVYHELDVPTLESIYQELISKKHESTKKVEKKGKPIYPDESEEDTDSEDEKELEYSCIIIDDYADMLKDKSIQKELNKMIIKARHLCCGFIFTLQSFYYMPRILRKQITYCSIYKPKTLPEWYSIADELLNLKKDDAMTLYDYTYNEPYTHLDIDTAKNVIYKNFNMLEMKS